jgi:hypothetical protein
MQFYEAVRRETSRISKEREGGFKQISFPLDRPKKIL